MTEREERLEEALLCIKQWAEMYPVKAFKPLGVEDLRHANFALKAIGIDMGALHASWANHILRGVVRFAQEALDDR